MSHTRAENNSWPKKDIVRHFLWDCFSFWHSTVLTMPISVIFYCFYAIVNIHMRKFNWPICVNSDTKLLFPNFLFCIVLNSLYFALIFMWETLLNTQTEWRVKLCRRFLRITPHASPILVSKSSVFPYSLCLTFSVTFARNCRRVLSSGYYGWKWTYLYSYYSQSVS